MKMTLMSAPSMLMTSESVTEGHPDKLCDQIADAILDEILACDPMAHVACEVTATTGLVVIIGEITTVHHVDYTKIARETIRRVGYTNPEYGFDADSCGIVTSIKAQSPEIANAVGEDQEAVGEARGRATRGSWWAPPATRRRSSCPCPSSWPTSSAAAWPRCAKRAFCPTCGPTASPR